jgi:hypothetical protein
MAKAPWGCLVIETAVQRWLMLLMKARLSTLVSRLVIAPSMVFRAMPIARPWLAWGPSVIGRWVQGLSVMSGFMIGVYPILMSPESVRTASWKWMMSSNSRMRIQTSRRDVGALDLQIRHSITDIFYPIVPSRHRGPRIRPNRVVK